MAVWEVEIGLSQKSLRIFKGKFAHGVMKPVQRKNVLVECGSTQCEFDTKAYQIEESYYVNRRRQSPSPPVASQSGHGRSAMTTEVHNNLQQDAEQSVSAPAQSRFGPKTSV